MRWATAARAIRTGEIDFAIAGGVESMTRAPLVMGKAQSPFARAEIFDTTIGWRFVNPLLKAQYGVDSMPETAENVAEAHQVRARGPGQIRMPQPATRRPAIAAGFFAEESVRVHAKDAKGKPVTVERTNIPGPKPRSKTSRN